MGATDPTTRVLRLLALLQARAQWAPQELAERLGVSTRTLRRDLSRLEGLDIRVVRRPGPGGHYALGRGNRIPPLVFDDEEVLALVLGLRMVEERLGDDASGRALAKLLHVLPGRLAELARDLAEHSEALHREPVDVEPGVLAALAGAGARSLSVGFTYLDQQGRTSTRTVDSVHCLQSRGVWYVVAHDLGRSEWRLFRVDRVSDLRTGPPAPRRDPPAAEVSRWLTSDFGRAEPAE